MRWVREKLEALAPAALHVEQGDAKHVSAGVLQQGSMWRRRLRHELRGATECQSGDDETQQAQARQGRAAAGARSGDGGLGSEGRHA